MIYPNNFEEKIGFADIRQQLEHLCLSDMGRERVADMSPGTLASFICLLQSQVAEMMAALRSADDFPASNYHDMRPALRRIRVIGSFLEVHEMWDLKRSLETINDIVAFLRREEEEEGGAHERQLYPALCQLAQGLDTFRDVCRDIDRIIDKFGGVKDNASPELAQIRAELSRLENSIGGTLQGILRQAQESGLVEQGTRPTLRDGRLVLPVQPALKRKIRGIVHDESATGKTVFIEPAEVVEANNRIRELQADERREIVRILQAFTDGIRPKTQNILAAYSFLGTIDFIRAKALMAISQEAITVQPTDTPVIDWAMARHPLLAATLRKHGKKVVPLDVELTSTKHILVISGPNAGGKSVCLKTVGLLQYMLQCGMAIPVAESSRTGIFRNIMIDIGDEQSIEDELSTYSSHLLNMKNMMRHADGRTLLLIDEFGGGTEPLIGGAMAEAILKRFLSRRAFAIITTHYHNLKGFADNNPGVVNGAMLYDRQNMQALFTLSIGRPGSSFAVEIARKIGIPEDVIADASEIVGQDYINADKYLQDIVRDKRYWEHKRQLIHEEEKKLLAENERLQRELEELRAQRRDILGRAREQAENLINESNARIEATIKDIREAQAEKERTKDIRQELRDFHSTLADTHEDELIDKKMRQIEERQRRKQKRKDQSGKQTGQNAQQNAEPAGAAAAQPLTVGDTVRIKGQTTVGTIQQIDGKNAVVTFGMMRTNVKTDRLEHADPPQPKMNEQIATIGKATRQAIDEWKINFHQDIDVRGMRGDEALMAVQYFIDDAAMLGVSRVCILHGTGSGILRTLIRQYLGKLPVVRHYADEHVQFGGAGITVVDL